MKFKATTDFAKKQYIYDWKTKQKANKQKNKSEMKEWREKICTHIQKSSQKIVSFGDGQSDKCPGKNIFPAKITFAELFLDTSRIPVLIPSCGGKRNWEQWEQEMK